MDPSLIGTAPAMSCFPTASCPCPVTCIWPCVSSCVSSCVSTRDVIFQDVSALPKPYQLISLSPLLPIAGSRCPTHQPTGRLVVVPSTVPKPSLLPSRLPPTSRDPASGLGPVLNLRLEAPTTYLPILGIQPRTIIGPLEASPVTSIIPSRDQTPS